jgi:uncharacterized protein
MQRVGGHFQFSPSDLNDYVECEHLTALALEVARGARLRPHVPNQYADLLRHKGEEHEAAYLAQLRREGREVVEVGPPDTWDFDAAARATAEAMRAGAEVIYQATFVHGDWRGRADFLERVEQPSVLGPWSYEPVDAKLARAEKPTYVLQLCFYSEAIGAIQGAPPERMHVLLGIGERRALRHADFAAYYRRVRRGFEAAIGRPRATEPYPVEHCALCEFREVCDDRWREEDHLVLVAGMRRDQVARLRAGGIPTLARLGQARPGTAVDRVAPHTFETLHDQAALQLAWRTTGRLDWHPLPAEPGCGFGLLPRPSPGDVVFDIEGDPFWEPARGLHFLFGLLLAEDGDWGYQPIWAHDRAGEQRAFEALIDLLHDRLARHPDMHVYHYGGYETTAVKQLMGVYATREDAVDDLLRHGVFVNLHTVVRQGIRAGLPGYSLKDVEVLAEFRRRADVKSGTQAVLEYERWMETRDGALLDAIASYNEEDCRAALALRDWLFRQRPDTTPWPDVLVPSEADEEKRAADQEREGLRQALVEGAAPGSPRWLAGELLEYHRREARPAWWQFFERRDHMSPDDLVADSESIGKVEPEGAPPLRLKQSLVYRLRFLPQQHKLAPGDAPFDPATKAAAGTILDLDDGTGILVLRRGPKLTGVPLPRALIPAGPYQTREQRAALGRLASSMLAEDTRYPALRDILARARPRLVGGRTRDSIQATDLDDLRDLATSLDGSYLFIQGPPGTGKTWTGARIVVELMRQGRRVGVAATSHKAIHNLLDEIEESAREESVAFRGLKKASAGNEESVYAGPSVSSETDIAAFANARRDVLLFAGTAWLFAHADLDGSGRGGPLIDTLVVDEAGQVALADALAMGTAARNVILLGDPLQLAQVSQGTHPAGTEASVLEHLLGEHATVPPDMGVFLERTRRMHPDVCRFVSEIVYDSRLEWTPDVARQSTALGTGLRYLPVDHAGNASVSAEEAARVAAEIRAMLGAQWTSAKGETRPFGQFNFMVVAPYNAQVRRLRQALQAAGLGDVPVGTVDKFQGREAPVVFYSMATSSAEDVPRSLEFLFSRNRLNVAVSRAMCLAYVVASPRLLESRVRTIEQMRLVNALCRFVEMAEAQGRDCV